MMIQMRKTTVLLMALLALGGCKGKADSQPLDKAGVRFTVIEKLHELNVSEEEVAQVVKARATGMRDDYCLELVRLARSRGAEFAEGDAVAKLAGVQFSEDEVMELARLNQIGLWVGEAQVLRFAGVNKPVILALARERAAARPVPASTGIVALKDAGFSDNEMISFIERGMTEAQAMQAARVHAPRGGTRFRRLR